ncbi:sulfotransferase [uncultured Roseobacter sp.]|uniref:sulfotransferase family protein n=1 Tax=uncultured Roseobacter sp. TaxID=114847 RepID=UPI002607F739|nr:sulfotransferase [uncultured Roseobacter sp.]
MNAGRKPEIVCIGAQKAGTSWLHVTLSARSDIWVPPFKELHFFDHKFVQECRRWTPWHVKKGLKEARARHLAKTVPPNEDYLNYLSRLEERPILNGTWYKFVFSRAAPDQMCLDVTPEYSCIPDAGVDFFKRFLPEAKLIYIIRNPLDRLTSQLRMAAQRKKVPPTSQTDWNELLEMSALKTRGDYKANVTRWDARFAPDQLLYLPFGRIRKDPLGVLRQIESHCGLPSQDYKTAHQQVHQTAPMIIPDFVIEQLQNATAEQDQFLQDRFGADFFEASS